MKYKEFGVKIAKEAGRIIEKNFKGGMKKEWKGNGTPVTQTDLFINKMVIAEVKKCFPTHDVLGEEESSLNNKSKFLWVCDPVDGTIPFSHGIPTCVFSLALVEDGLPIFGVVYDPFMKRVFTAEKGKGAFLNNKKIKVSNKGLENSVLNWESSITVGDLKKAYPNCLPITLNSFIYGGMLVASGELVACLYSWKYSHDCASLKIIVEEAGGQTSDIRGLDQRYDGVVNGMLVSNGLVHQKLLKVIKSKTLRKQGYDFV